MKKSLPISHPYQCRNKVCGGYCMLKDIECPDKWVFPDDCPLEEIKE